MQKRGITAKPVLVLVWLVLVSGSLRASRLEVPFEWKGGHIVVHGSIGEVSGLNLVIDTGASSTTISKRVAKKLGLKGQKKEVLAYGSGVRVEEVTLPTLEIGARRWEAVSAWIVDRLSAADAREMLRMDALIGLDFLRQTNLTIQYESQMLVFGATEPGPSSQAFYPGLPFLVMRLSVGGKPVRVLLDSGAEDLILYQRRVEDRLPMKRSREVKEIRHAGGRARLQGIRLTKVVVGGTEWSELDAFLLDGKPPDNGLDGVLGIRSLGFKQLSVDFQANRVSWQR